MSVRAKMPRMWALGIGLSIVLPGCGVSGYEVVRVASDDVPSTDAKTAVANCPQGKKALGGGRVVAYQLGNSFPEDPDGVLFQSEPTGDYGGWRASAIDRTPGHLWAVIAYAICAKVTP